MIEKVNSVPEEQANLHIVENMDVNNLPQLLQSVLSLAQTPAEKDMLLLSSLVACGSVMPNLYCRYGIAAKRYYPNLQLFIVGSAACGKGIANLALELVKGTEKVEQPQVKPLDQKQILLSLLPEEFESKTLVEEAQLQGISRRTAFNWSEEWQAHGVILKIRHGVFKKNAAVA